MTLTEAAFWTKRFGGIALVAGIVFIIVILIITLQPKQSMPSQYLTANYACTEKREEFLENRLEIPSLELASGSEMVFEINTDSGKIDSLPQIINVYKFDNPTQSLTAQAGAKILANKMGFNPDSIIRNGARSYVWEDIASKRVLEVEAKNLNFSLKTDSDYIREVSETGSLPTDQEAKITAATALRTLGLYTEDYAAGTPRYTYININPDGSFSKALSASEAELIRVDFVRNKSMITIQANLVGADDMVKTLTKRMGTEPTTTKEIINDERVDIYTFDTLVALPNSQNSNISVYVGVENKDKDLDLPMPSIYQIDYKYWPIETQACGTYELISPQYAIEMVQSGKGSLAYLYEKDGDYVSEYIPENVKKFIVNQDIYIVYYESYDELEYLQPVYLISGEVIFSDDTKGTFDIYYPAINYDIVQDKIDLPEPEIEKSNSIF